MAHKGDASHCLMCWPGSDVLAQNFYFQVKFINFYLREIISFTKKLTLETGASLVSLWC